MNIKPLGSNVVIKPIEEDEGETKTEAGIIIPESAKEEKPAQGKITAVGPGALTRDGKRQPMSVKVGDKVLYNEGYSPTKFKSEGKEYLVVDESTIIGIIED